VLPTLAELGIGFVPYMPLGAGFLTGGIRSFDDLAEDDFRRNLPRFQPGIIEQNVEVADRIQEIAAARGDTGAQVALAWVLSRGEMIVPIFGTRRAANVEANVAAVGFELTAEEIAELDTLSSRASGERAPTFVRNLNQ
jgi:aryl-alcohol dehydrogenase-like predicted oxidoreductase